MIILNHLFLDKNNFNPFNFRKKYFVVRSWKWKFYDDIANWLLVALTFVSILLMDELEELVPMLNWELCDLAEISLIPKDDDQLVISSDLFSSLMGLDGMYSLIGCSHDFSCYFHPSLANVKRFWIVN